MSQSVEIPSGLVKLEKAVTRWRRVRKLPCPMPAELWDRAALLARELGVGKVAQALGLNQTTLKDRMADKPGSCLATFVELLPAPSSPTPAGLNHVLKECALEVDSTDGFRIRVMLKDVPAGSLVSVLRQFAQGNR